jgi:hypothetical protein
MERRGRTRLALDMERELKVRNVALILTVPNQFLSPTINTCIRNKIDNEDKYRLKFGFRDDVPLIEVNGLVEELQFLFSHNVLQMNVFIAPQRTAKADPMNDTINIYPYDIMRLQK